MQVVVVAGSVCAALVLWAYVCTRVARRLRARGHRVPFPPPVRQRAAVPRPRAQLPEGHRPPPGLGPLSPSERFLTSEAARGLRELQAFLVDQRAA